MKKKALRVVKMNVMDSDGDAVKLTEKKSTAQTLPDKIACPLDSSSDNKDREDESEKTLDVQTNEITPSNALNAERIFDKDVNIETEKINSYTNILIEPFQPLCEDINSTNNSESDTDLVIDGVLTNTRKFKIVRHESDDQTAKGAASINDDMESGLKESQEEIIAGSAINAENKVLAYVSRPFKLNTVQNIRNQLEKCIDEKDKNSNTSKVIELAIKRSVLHRRCTIVKKYPERTCSKVNKLENETKEEKKPFPKSNVKLMQKSKSIFKQILQSPAEDKTLSQTSDSGKPKKKRRRKVKPWPWGNEKKKYKPKIKTLPSSPFPPEESEETADVLKNDLITQNNVIQLDKPGAQNEVLSESGTRAESPLKMVEITGMKNEIEGSKTSDTHCMNQLQIETNLVPSTSDPIGKLPKKSIKRSGSKKHSISRKRKNLCLNGDQKAVTTSELDSQDKLPDKEEKHDSTLKEEMNYKLLSEPGISNYCSESYINEKIDPFKFCEETLQQSTSHSTNSEITLKKGKINKKIGKGPVKNRQNHKEQASATNFNDKAEDFLSSELQDNQPRLDNAHVSTDSGIESVACSPVGNKSLNSVLSSETPQSIVYHPTAVQFSSNNSSTNSNKSDFAESIFSTISSSVLFACPSSATTSTVSLGNNFDISNNTCRSVCTTTCSMVPSVCFSSVCESETLTDVKDVNRPSELLRDKQSNSTEILKEPNAGSILLSRKKNRAKFLQNFKTSVLLQQGRMPHESIEEQMLEDKLSYLTKLRGNESNEGVTKLVYLNDTVLFKPDTAISTRSSETPSDKYFHEPEETSAEPISNKTVDKTDVPDISTQRDLYHHQQYVSRQIENNTDVDNQAALDSVLNFPQSDDSNRTDLSVSEAIEGNLTTSPHIRKSNLDLRGKKSNHKSERHSKHKTYGPAPDLPKIDLTQDYDFNAHEIEMPNLLESPHSSGVPVEVYSAFGSGSVPSQSDRSIDSNTSSACSSLGAKSNFQFMTDVSKHKRKKNKKKLLYFKTKYKNIIYPVYVGEMDCLIRDFPSLSISASEETYIKVRPGEVPLPSIFRVSIINVKKKKKDKLSIFKKSGPLKYINSHESDLRERVKLGRRKGTDNLFETFNSELAGSQDSQYLPPNKKHKLFSELDAEKSRSCVSQKSQEKKS